MSAQLLTWREAHPDQTLHGPLAQGALVLARLGLQYSQEAEAEARRSSEGRLSRLGVRYYLNQLIEPLGRQVSQFFITVAALTKFLQRRHRRAGRPLVLQRRYGFDECLSSLLEILRPPAPQASLSYQRATFLSQQPRSHYDSLDVYFLGLVGGI